MKLPALIVASGERTGISFLEFFALIIRNLHTRRPYARAVGNFLIWSEAANVGSVVLSVLAPVTDLVAAGRLT